MRTIALVNEITDQLFTEEEMPENFGVSIVNGVIKIVMSPVEEIANISRLQNDLQRAIHLSFANSVITLLIYKDDVTKLLAARKGKI